MSVSKNYQRWTRDTAIYPDAGEGTSVACAYVLAGLTSEIGELFVASTYEDVLKEFGDVMWYMGRMCDETKCMPFHELILIRTNPDFTMLAQNMLVGLSTASDKIKKYMRDGLHESKRKEFNDAIEYGLISIFSSCVSYVEYAQQRQGEELEAMKLIEKCLKKNMDKLLSRQDRKVLGGSGDDR